MENWRYDVGLHGPLGFSWVALFLVTVTATAALPGRGALKFLF